MRFFMQRPSGTASGPIKNRANHNGTHRARWWFVLFRNSLEPLTIPKIEFPLLRLSTNNTSCAMCLFEKRAC